LDVHLSPDLTTGVPATGTPFPEGGPRRLEVETTRIAQITMRSRGKGFLEGARIGALVGGIVGLVTPQESLEEEYYTRGHAVGLAAFGGALYGGIIGAIRASRTHILIR
jgi:hypothetical protein